MLIKYNGVNVLFALFALFAGFWSMFTH